MKIISKILLTAAICPLLMMPAYGQANANAKQNPPSTTVQGEGPVLEAMEMNMAEVELGKLAAKKATNPKVRDFGMMMTKDHEQALTQLRNVDGSTLFDGKMTVKHQETFDRLSKLAGADFDREYMNAMVAGHEAAVAFFEKWGAPPVAKITSTDAPADAQKAPPQPGTPGAGGAHHPEFSILANELLPVVRQHLQQAKLIQKELMTGLTAEVK